MSRIYARSEFVWKDNKLYQGKDLIGEVIKEQNNPLWRFQLTDEPISEDYYNLSRAKDHLVKQALRKLNNGQELPAYQVAI